MFLCSWDTGAQRLRSSKSDSQHPVYSAAPLLLCTFTCVCKSSLEEKLRIYIEATQKACPSKNTIMPPFCAGHNRQKRNASFEIIFFQYECPQRTLNCFSLLPPGSSWFNNGLFLHLFYQVFNKLKRPTSISNKRQETSKKQKQKKPSTMAKLFRPVSFKKTIGNRLSWAIFALHICIL